MVVDGTGQQMPDQGNAGRQTGQSLRVAHLPSRAVSYPRHDTTCVIAIPTLGRNDYHRSPFANRYEQGMLRSGVRFRLPCPHGSIPIPTLVGGDHNGIDTIECGRIKVDLSAQPVAGRLDGLPKSIRATSQRGFDLDYAPAGCRPIIMCCLPS
jgi:hypothetical protein